MNYIDVNQLNFKFDTGDVIVLKTQPCGVRAMVLAQILYISKDADGDTVIERLYRIRDGHSCVDFSEREIMLATAEG